MKKIITFLAIMMFASLNVSYAAMPVSATPSYSTPSITASTPEKKESVKDFLAKKAADLSQKQIIAAVLAFFLGNFGVHNFYLGRRKQGIWQLVLTVVGILTSFILVGIPILIAVWIWAIVDLIRILTGKLGA